MRAFLKRTVCFAVTFIPAFSIASAANVPPDTIVINSFDDGVKNRFKVFNHARDFDGKRAVVDCIFFKSTSSSVTCQIPLWTTIVVKLSDIKAQSASELYKRECHNGPGPRCRGYVLGTLKYEFHTITMGDAEILWSSNSLSPEEIKRCFGADKRCPDPDDVNVMEQP